MSSDNVTLAKVQQLVARLAIENSQLSAENRRLRKLKANAGRGRILERCAGRCHGNGHLALCRVQHQP